MYKKVNLVLVGLNKLMIVDSSQFKRRRQKIKRRNFLKLGLTLIIIVLLTGVIQKIQKNIKFKIYTFLISEVPQLAMSGGDPYIRALMLTISASESNHKNSYFLLYGGRHVHNLKEHPNQCLPIKKGVNRGKCSTAAGRYQFLNSTWQEKATKYHPKPIHSPHGFLYSFEPEYQDIVVYRWLKDDHQWNVDVLTLLKQDRVEEVLTALSGVWTSLGNGIEDNSMTPYLPELYRYFLAKELASQDKNQEYRSQNRL